MSEQNTGGLSEATLEARRAYYREYHKKNKEKRNQWAANHWEKVAKENEERDKK